MTWYDLNGKKGISLEEANEHYRNGGGTDLHIDMSDLDFSELSPEDFPNAPGRDLIDLIFHGTREAPVFGRLWMTYLGDDKVKASDGFDRYNFNLDNSWKSIGGICHNIENIYGNYEAGTGTSYTIYLDGEGTIGGEGSPILNTVVNGTNFVINLWT
jgi:hypothetical protein